MAEPSMRPVPSEDARSETVTPVKKSQASLESVHAENVQMQQSAAGFIKADTVSMANSAAQSIQAQTVQATDCGIVVAHATTLNINDGGAVIASAANADVNGNVGVMIGQTVQLKDHRTGLVVAREVHANHVQSVIYLAGQSNAPVETIADQRSVALFGLSMGIALGLVLSVFRLIKRH